MDLAGLWNAVTPPVSGLGRKFFLADGILGQEKVRIPRMIKKNSISRSAPETILETLKKAEKAQTPDGEFIFCPVCLKMSWLGHTPDCVLALGKDLLEAALRED